MVVVVVVVVSKQTLLNCTYDAPGHFLLYILCWLSRESRSLAPSSLSVRDAPHRFARIS